MDPEITFREYLERRRLGDYGVQDFLAAREPSILERRSWPDLMAAFQADGAKPNYIWTARRLHQEYMQAMAKELE